MSYRTVIDKVLTRLREDTIGSNWVGAISSASEVDSYQKLIGEFVNEAKDIAEDSWNWTSLRSIETVTTSASTATYDMSNINDRSRVLQVLDNTNDNVLKQISDNHFYNYTYLGSTQTANPSYYRLNDNDISFWPTPDATYDIKVHAVIPQSDRTLAADTFTIPENIIVLGAYSLALAERGEDGGTSSDLALRRFQQAVGDAIVQDENRTIDETTWYAS
jgi:hypothetical protein|tara:strand:- start:1565 stop:2221 length:657 start_codon:yes stop_codon:yes gene_type:complete